MNVKYIYPKELVDSHFKRDSIENLGRNISNLLYVALAIIAIGFLLFSIATQNPGLFAFGAVIGFFYYACATMGITEVQKGIEINDREIKLLLFFPHLWYKRALTSIQRIKFNPEIKGAKRVLSEYELTAVKIYFWVYAGRGITDNKTFVPVTIFLPMQILGS